MILVFQPVACEALVSVAILKYIFPSFSLLLSEKCEKSLFPCMGSLEAVNLVHKKFNLSYDVLLQRGNKIIIFLFSEQIMNKCFVPQTCVDNIMAKLLKG